MIYSNFLYYIVFLWLLNEDPAGQKLSVPVWQRGVLRLRLRLTLVTACPDVLLHFEMSECLLLLLISVWNDKSKYCVLNDSG